MPCTALQAPAEGMQNERRRETKQGWGTEAGTRVKAGKKRPLAMTAPRKGSQKQQQALASSPEKEGGADARQGQGQGQSWPGSMSGSAFVLRLTESSRWGEPLASVFSGLWGEAGPVPSATLQPPLPKKKRGPEKVNVMVTELGQFWPPGSYPLLPGAFPFSGSLIWMEPSSTSIAEGSLIYFPINIKGHLFILCSIHVHITYVIYVFCFLSDNLIHLLLDGNSATSVPRSTSICPMRKRSHRLRDLPEVTQLAKGRTRICT